MASEDLNDLKIVCGITLCGIALPDPNRTVHGTTKNDVLLTAGNVKESNNVPKVFVRRIGKDGKASAMMLVLLNTIVSTDSGLEPVSTTDLTHQWIPEGNVVVRGESKNV